MSSEIADLITKLRNDRRARIVSLVVAAILLITLSLGFAFTRAEASETRPSIMPVFSDKGQTPSAYIITTPDRIMFFCAITQGATVYTCQQLPSGE